MKIKYILLFLISFEGLSKNYECMIASKKYEKIYGLPENLLLSVALTESGKRVENGEFISWPWTINTKGKGKFFKTKSEAVNFVAKYTKKGKKNIDLGCMQVNYMYHPKAFKSFDEAFDPDTNVKWSAKTLKNLYKKFGSWKEAVGYYHSYRKKNRKKYSTKVFNNLLNVKKYNYNFEKELALKKNIKDRNDIAFNKNYITPIKNSALINRKKTKDPMPTHSPYIMARMEKVNFFRNYFYSLNKD